MLCSLGKESPRCEILLMILGYNHTLAVKFHTSTSSEPLLVLRSAGVNHHLKMMNLKLQLSDLFSVGEPCQRMPCSQHRMRNMTQK